MKQQADIREDFRKTIDELSEYAEPMQDYLSGLEQKLADCPADRLTVDGLNLLKQVLLHVKHIERLTDFFGGESFKLELLTEIQALERDIRPKPKAIRFKSDTLSYQFEAAIHQTAMDAYAYAVEKDLDAFSVGGMFITMHCSLALSIPNAGFSMDKLTCHKKPDGDYEIRRVPLGKDDRKFSCEIVGE